MFKGLLSILVAAVLLLGCGGGENSSVTTITGGGQQGPQAGPVIRAAFVALDNNLEVVVDAGPTDGFSLAQANILYATVTVCEPGSSFNCQTIDHIQVDTGSVGLRVLASKVKALNLPSVELATDAVNGRPIVAHECYPFVIGGLWGPNKVADVGLGKQLATRIPIQLIQDDAAALPAVPQDCTDAADEKILSSASTLGSNGILGIGSVTLDCGHICVLGDYSNSYVQYWACPQDAISSVNCQAAAIPANFQVFNPVAALPQHNNGVVLTLPAVDGLGASKVYGELIFGINTSSSSASSNNQLAATARRVNLGVDWQNNFASYLNVTTQFNGATIANSYLDTGTNALFFTDTGITNCLGSTWFCPKDLLHLSAVLSDGDNPAQNKTTVAFDVGNADSLFSTTNTAFPLLAGTYTAAAASGPSFSWGLPFFYGRRTYLSIWQQAGAENGPWYAF